MFKSERKRLSYCRGSSPAFDGAVFVPPLWDRFLLEVGVLFILHCGIKFSACAHGGFRECQLSLQRRPQPPLLLAMALLGCPPCGRRSAGQNHLPGRELSSSSVQTSTSCLAAAAGSGWELPRGQCPSDGTSRRA